MNHAQTVRDLAAKHFGPAAVTPADVETVRAALDGQTDLSMHHCLHLAHAAGVTWTPRQMKEVQADALFADMRAHLHARVDALDTRSTNAARDHGKLDYAAMQEATRLQTALDVLAEYADVVDVEPKPATAPVARVLPRPVRLPRRAHQPIPYMPTCAGYGLPFPTTNADADAPRLDIAA